MRERKAGDVSRRNAQPYLSGFLQRLINGIIGRCRVAKVLEHLLKHRCNKSDLNCSKISLQFIYLTNCSHDSVY